ncbi:MAG: MBL fold metallo-hydrolase RNA specificity domain-containing protein, partial [Halobacteriota archaeon]
VNGGFKYHRGVDEAFALSDHADFRDLTKFVDQCNPEVVFTCHGFATRFAHTIRELLGIEAIALETGQHILSNYV